MIGEKSIQSKKIAIYSPAAVGSLGHSFIYAKMLCHYLSSDVNLELFTLQGDSDKIVELNNAGIRTVCSDRFRVGAINKSRFNRFKYFREVFYGVYRIRYGYLLLKEFYNKFSDFNIYHLFEFEYFSAFIYFLFHKRNLANTILGFHIVDFKWIRGRSVVINLYKTGLYLLVKFLIRKVKYSTVHGDYLREMMLNQFRLKNKKVNNIIAIPYGCFIKREPINSKTILREKLHIPMDKIVALSFGILRKDKNIFWLLEALKHTDNIILFLIGAEGDISKNEIEEAIDKHQIRNRIKLKIEYIKEEDISQYFYLADFVLLAYSGWRHSFSGPLSLAVEHNRPVLASDVGEMGSFIRRNKNGILIEPDNLNKLISGIKTMSRKYEEWDEFDFNRLQKENSWEKMAIEINKLYMT